MSCTLIDKLIIPVKITKDIQLTAKNKNYCLKIPTEKAFSRYFARVKLSGGFANSQDLPHSLLLRLIKTTCIMFNVKIKRNSRCQQQTTPSHPAI
ncbi:unnamed protein product [Hermetia illucens]|uniref:Uncharacterized protein n=1 Tax=Hermetia illucens TaxID=343691 RepID=A0A7R8UCG4_HERIL|nr:unnamed protein product [Hermetia illucens]